MRVPSSSITAALTTQLQRLSTKQALAQNQLVTLKRVKNLSDDPSASAQILNISKERQQLQQYTRNNARALEVSQATFAGLNSLKSVSDRAGELAHLGAGAVGPDAKKAYAAEVNELINHAFQVANTRYSGDYIFGGTATDTAPFAATRDADGKITGVSYGGAASGPEIRIAEDATVSPFTNGNENQAIADFLNRLIALRDSLEGTSGASLESIQADLSDSETALITTISGVGTVQTRLEINEKQNLSRFGSLTNIASQLTDIDISTASVKLMQANTAYQAALQSGSMIMQTSLLNYLK